MEITYEFFIPKFRDKMIDKARPFSDILEICAALPKKMFVGDMEEIMTLHERLRFRQLSVQKKLVTFGYEVDRWVEDSTEETVKKLLSIKKDEPRISKSLLESILVKK